jgi:AraC-like DNA-binding protein
MTALNSHPSLIGARPEGPVVMGAARPPMPASLALKGRDASDVEWSVSPTLLEGWRELVAFETAGAAIMGDFTLSGAASVDVSPRDLFFIQLPLNGHDTQLEGDELRHAAEDHILFGRMRAAEETSFVMPEGARWRSLFVAISEAATRQLWGMGSDDLVRTLARACPSGQAGEAGMGCAYYGRPSRRRRLEQIFNCALPAPLRNAFLWSRSFELMVDIVSDLLQEAAIEPLAASRTRRAMLVAKEIIHKELSKPHTIDALSFRVGLSRRDFMTSFKEHFDVTFHEYYMGVRMAEAEAMLRDGRHRISDVAREVGYAQLSSFSRAFKAFHGVSPCQLGADV